MKIETWKENKILRSISEPISRDELKKYSKIWKEMIEYIKNPRNGWVWLAAPQIGINKRFFIVSLISDFDQRSYPTIAMYNPEILEYSEDTCIDTEGCFSVPWKYVDVERSNKIKIAFLDDKGRKNTMMLSWLPARFVQHEYDHLNGILLIDRVSGELPVNAQSL